jgi:hypothetical protein
MRLLPALQVIELAVIYEFLLVKSTAQFRNRARGRRAGLAGWDLTPMPAIGSVSCCTVALADFCAVVMLNLLAFHSRLAYLSCNPATTAAFDTPPHSWSAFPRQPRPPGPGRLS